jgi:hypothetical protein
MSLLVLLSVFIASHCVLAEPLESSQHAALMIVYDGLGSFAWCLENRIFSFFFFLFFFFQVAMRPRVHDSVRRRIAHCQLLVLVAMSRACTFLCRLR